MVHGMPDQRQITCSEDFALKLVQAIVTGRETDNVIKQLEIKMATLSEVQAKQAAAITATQNAVKRVVDENTRQNALIKELQDKIASGEVVTAADLDPLVSGNDQIISLVEGLDNIPAPVPTP